MIPESIDNPVDGITKNFRAHQSSLLVKWSKLMVSVDDNSGKAEPLFGIIETESFSAPCISVPYNIENEDIAHYYLFIEPCPSWNHIFVSFLKNGLEIYE